MLGINILPNKEESFFSNSKLDVRTPIFKMKSKDPNSNEKYDESHDDDP
jgi:hypothetical protein